MIATTVCRRGVYIHSPVARTFFCVQRAHCVLRTLLMRVTHAWLKGAKKVLCTCVISLHLTDSGLMSHPSLLFLAGHFETIPDADIHKFLPYSLVLKKHRACASPHEDEKFGYLAKSALNTGYEPKKFDKITSVDSDTMLIDDPDFNEISDFSKNTHQNTGLFGVLTMFESSVSHVFHDDFALQIAKKACIGKPIARQRETERERENVLWSVLQSRCQRKVDGTVLGVIFFRLSENSILMGWDLREHLQRRPRQSILGENSIQRKVYLNEYKMKIQNSERRNSEYASFESQRELESQRRQKLKANQWADQAQRERVHLCSRLGMKDHLHEESYARSCRENWRIEKRLSRGNYWKTVKIGRISCAAWSGITNSESILLRSWLTEQLWRSSCYFEFEKA